jgi:hypothetical protein
MRCCSVSSDGKAKMDFGPSNAALMWFAGLYDMKRTLSFICCGYEKYLIYRKSKRLHFCKRLKKVTEQ